jgi:hypothetical protein
MLRRHWQILGVIAASKPQYLRFARDDKLMFGIRSRKPKPDS